MRPFTKKIMSAFSRAHPHRLRVASHVVVHATLTLGCSLLFSSITARAQPMIMMPMTDPTGLSMTRMGSGTSWLPDSAPMYGAMPTVGAWTFMLHGSAFAQAIVQGSPRGASQVGSINWGMASAMREVQGGRLQLRGMMSLDAFTVGGRGYPLLQQTGEQYRGVAIRDRQHPHDLFMEVAAIYEHSLTSNVALQLYAAPVGEPALGPAAFPHRPSADANPFATIAHHWEDATHVSFGVATAALYTNRVKFEVSAFNAREPDDVRTNFDLRGARLNALSARVSVNPSPTLSWQASYGNLPGAEASDHHASIKRATTSLLWSLADASGRARSFAFIVGANGRDGASWSPAVTIESQAYVTATTQLYARAEAIRDGEMTMHTIGQLTVGASRDLSIARAGRFAIGAGGTINVAPLSAGYGTRVPFGGVVYARWTAARMRPMH